jgi:hypothetical protein
VIFKRKERGTRTVKFSDLSIGHTFRIDYFSACNDKPLLMKVETAHCNDLGIRNAIELNSGVSLFIAPESGVYPIRIECEWEDVEESCLDDFFNE